MPTGHELSRTWSWRGNALPRPTEALHHHPEPLRRSIKMHFSIRKSAPKHVPLIFAASVCATFHTVFLVTLHTLTSSSTSCSISDTACSYIHYTCRVQQVRAGAISGTELSHNILLYFKFHMVAGEHHGVGSTSSSVPQAGGLGARRRGSRPPRRRKFDD